jgi:Protein of unknown function (DUF1559)
MLIQRFASGLGVQIRTGARMVVASCLFFLFASVGPAQETPGKDSATAKAAPRKMSTRFLPDSALLCLDIQPNAILTSPQARFLPTEVIKVVCEEQVGIQLDNIQFARVVMDMPQGPGAPGSAVVIAFNQDVSIEQLKPGLVDLESTLEISSKKAYRVQAPEPVFLVPVSNRLWIIGTESYLPTVIEAANNNSSTGRLAEIVREVDLRGHLQLVLDLEPIKPLLGMGIMSAAEDIPPSLAKLPELVNHFDAAWTTVDVTRPFELFSYGQMVFRVTDDDAADHVENVLNESLESFRSYLVSEGQKEFKEENKINDAWRSYMQRVSLEITPLLKPRREGRLFYGPSYENTPEIAMGGVMVGLLLPAVQAAREAARRMTASNGLKQIGLAMHNYHAAYNKLPSPAITDADGKPLLSWRVAILPFIEEQALYEEFHLDEPWDSEHNIKLVEKMPQVYTDPSYPLEPGKTVFQLAMGPEMAFTNDVEKPAFRDFLDGLSNTIMAYESSMASADIWTKPPEPILDTDNPLASTGDVHQGGFHVLMTDGAVTFVTNNIDLAMFRSMLTRAKSD